MERYSTYITVRVHISQIVTPQSACHIYVGPDLNLLSRQNALAGSTPCLRLRGSQTGLNHRRMMCDRRR